MLEQICGIWLTKCYDKKEFTRFEVEDICRSLGYTNGHAAMVGNSDKHYFRKPLTEVVRQPFTDVTFKGGVISVRNSDEPYAVEKLINKNKVCHRLDIECFNN